LSQKAVPHYADRLAAIFAERIRVFDCPDNLKRETALRLDSALGVFNFCGFDCQPEFFSIRISRKINADPLIWHLDSLDYHRWKNGSNMYRLRAFVSKDDLINRTDVKRKIVGTFASTVVKPENHIGVITIWAELGDGSVSFAQTHVGSLRALNGLTYQFVRLPSLNRIKANDQNANYLNDERGAVQTASKIFTEYAEPTLRAIKGLAYLCPAIF
jgi:hypothetical protein